MENTDRRNHGKPVEDLISSVKNMLKGIFDAESFMKYEDVLSKYQKLKIEPEALNKQVFLSSQSIGLNKNNTLLIEENNKVLKDLQSLFPDNKEIKALMKKNESSLLENQQDNNPIKQLKEGLVNTRNYLESKVIKENHLNTAHEMLQSILNLTYNSKIEYTSDEYKGERNVVGPALSRLNTESKNCSSKFYSLDNAKIVKGMVDVIDIPRSIFLKNDIKNQPLIKMDEKERFYKFTAKFKI